MTTKKNSPDVAVGAIATGLAKNEGAPNLAQNTKTIKFLKGYPSWYTPRMREAAYNVICRGLDASLDNIGKELNRTDPHRPLELECGFLSCFMQGGKLSPFIDVNTFKDSKNKIIFNAIRSVRILGLVGAESVIMFLRSTVELERAGGVKYIQWLSGVPGLPVMTAGYARELLAVRAEGR